MKFVCTFDDDYILAAHYDHNEMDEFERLFDEWTDIECLESFFNQNIKDLNRSFWGGISIDEAIIKTINEADKLRKHFKSLSVISAQKRISVFNDLFKPLNNQQSRFDYLDKKKVYGQHSKSWLRMYALKISNDMFLITGGTIKLTATMTEREHTRKELRKINACKEFLIKEGIIDEAGMVEFLEL